MLAIYIIIDHRSPMCFLKHILSVLSVQIEAYSMYIHNWGGLRVYWGEPEETHLVPCMAEVPVAMSVICTFTW